MALLSLWDEVRVVPSDHFLEMRDEFACLALDLTSFDAWMGAGSLLDSSTYVPYLRQTLE